MATGLSAGNRISRIGGGEWLLIDRKGNVLKRSNEWLKYSDAPATTPDTGRK